MMKVVKVGMIDWTVRRLRLVPGLLTMAILVVIGVTACGDGDEGKATNDASAHVAVPANGASTAASKVERQIYLICERARRDRRVFERNFPRDGLPPRSKIREYYRASARIAERSANEVKRLGLKGDDAELETVFRQIARLMMQFAAATDPWDDRRLEQLTRRMDKSSPEAGRAARRLGGPVCRAEGDLP